MDRRALIGLAAVAVALSFSTKHRPSLDLGRAAAEIGLQPRPFGAGQHRPVEHQHRRQPIAPSHGVIAQHDVVGARGHNAAAPQARGAKGGETEG